MLGGKKYQTPPHRGVTAYRYWQRQAVRYHKIGSFSTVYTQFRLFLSIYGIFRFKIIRFHEKSLSQAMRLWTGIF
jgi:hypothetical protein